MPEDKLLTIKQIAERLNVNQMTVRRRIAAGELPALKIGKSVRIRPEALAAYLERAAAAGAPPPVDPKG